MIRLLLALHPRFWRARYGQEFQALLEAEPLTASVVVDVLRNAARQQAAVHAVALLVLGALASSTVVEIFAVRADLTDNVLWPPSTPARALALAPLLLPWLPVAHHLTQAARRRRVPPVHT